ncbi:hypothetical protein Tco_1507358 [Tanacetum coccineum]
MATYFPESTSYTIKLDQIISKDIINQNTISTVLLPPITQREMVTFYSTNLHQTCDFSTMKEKLEAECVRSSPSFFITLGFRCAKTYHPGHQCYPPKFVFLESEDDPPWEPNDSRYKTMSLEDKARFKGGSIDMYLNVHDVIVGE